MKIFLVIPTLKQGGAERVISELANQFILKGQQVHLVLLALADDFYSVNKKVIIHRLDFENVNFLQKLFGELKIFFKLRKLLFNEKPDVVLSFGDKYNVFTLLATWFLNLNVFVSDRSNPKKKINFFTNLLRQFTYRYATGIIAQTSLAKEILKKSTKNSNIKIIPNPVKKISIEKFVRKENIILNIGRLVPEKGQHILIDIFCEINDKDWKLIILGEGPLRPLLEKQIADSKMKERIILEGSVPNVDDWLLRSSIFAFSSISEGFPNALVEAMSSGLPCLSFDCDAGPKDLISDGCNGFLVSLGDRAEYLNKLQLLMNNEDLRYTTGKAAENIAIDLESSKIAECYLNFIKSSLKHNQ